MAHVSAVAPKSLSSLVLVSSVGAVAVLLAAESSRTPTEESA